LPPLPQQFRFLLTFDDGPSTLADNPTLAILAQLAHNDIQPGIKGIFFVQTRNRNGGGSDIGQGVLRRIHAEGHVIGLHSADARGHVGHLRMSIDELHRTLMHGKEDIRAITGHAPELIRPPYLAYSDTTLALYEANGYKMLLSDVHARDGVIHFFNISFRRRSHLRAELHAVRRHASRGGLPQVADSIPVVVTFHDVNPFTARRFGEYLRILVEEAADAGLPLAAKPFYDSAATLQQTAQHRAHAPTRLVELERGTPTP
jgi:peptidoglycan/xylan/chitin deacetylase (PgdA/CDA1 family)